MEPEGDRPQPATVRWRPVTNDRDTLRSSPVGDHRPTLSAVCIARDAWHLGAEHPHATKSGVSSVGASLFTVRLSKHCCSIDFRPEQLAKPSSMTYCVRSILNEHTRPAYYITMLRENERLHTVSRRRDAQLSALAMRPVIIFVQQNS